VQGDEVRIADGEAGGNGAAGVVGSWVAIGGVEESG
jgi:hypothetical protein